MPEQSTNSAGFGWSMESEDAKEIMGASPRWIVRWGNLLVLANIILLLLLSIWIPFPEVIQGTASVSPAKKTFDIYIPPGTIAEKVLVSDHQLVQKGQPLLYLSKTAIAPATTASIATAALPSAAAASSSSKAVPLVLTSPADGMVVFQRDIRSLSDTTQKTCLMTIDPSGQRYNAVVTIGNTGSGKIRIGQQVIIQLDSYPGREFGNITGTVISKPQYANEHSSTIAVSLDRDVTTTYNKKLEIYAPAAGMAEIITSNKKLIWQIFSFL